MARRRDVANLLALARGDRPAGLHRERRAVRDRARTGVAGNGRPRGGGNGPGARAVRVHGDDLRLHPLPAGVEHAVDGDQLHGARDRLRRDARGRAQRVRGPPLRRRIRSGRHRRHGDRPVARARCRSSATRACATESTLQTAIGMRASAHRRRSPRARWADRSTRASSFTASRDGSCGTSRRSFCSPDSWFRWCCWLAAQASLAAGLVSAAFAIQFLGLLAERWYFFAEANHPQNLYYQAIS